MSVRLVDVGPVTVTAEKKNTVPLAPILGGATVVLGVALLLGRRRS